MFNKLFILNFSVLKCTYFSNKYCTYYIICVFILAINDTGAISAIAKRLGYRVEFVKNPHEEAKLKANKDIFRRYLLILYDIYITFIQIILFKIIFFLLF